MDSTPEDYEKFYPLSASQSIISTLNRYIPLMKWKNDDVVLDIGCGTGKVTKHELLPRCPNVKKIVAIDVDSASIDYAKKHYSHEKIEYRMQDAKQLELNDVGKFDKIFSQNAIHFICDFDELFSTVSAELKSGGYFCFVLVAKLVIYGIRRVLSRDEEWKKYIETEDMLALIPPTTDWDDVEGEFRNVLSKYGLNVIDSEYEVVDVAFPSKKMFTTFMQRVSPKEMFENMSMDVKENLWKKSEHLMFNGGTREENGGIITPAGMLRVYGQKE